MAEVLDQMPPCYRVASPEEADALVPGEDDFVLVSGKSLLPKEFRARVSRIADNVVRAVPCSHYYIPYYNASMVYGSVCAHCHDILVD